MPEIHYQQDRNKSFLPMEPTGEVKSSQRLIRIRWKKKLASDNDLHTPFCLLGSGVCTFPSEPEDHKIRIFITCDAP
jgi:hypothetical protein